MVLIQPEKLDRMCSGKNIQNIIPYEISAVFEEDPISCERLSS